MNFFDLHKTSNRKECSIFLAFFWLTGILSGMIYADAVFADSSAWIYGILHAPVSTINLLAIILLPALISVIACCIGSSFLLYFICFSVAFRFAFVSSGVYSAFADSGWLISFLILFHNVLSLPIYYFYWLRCIHTEKRNLTAIFSLFLISVEIFIFSLDIRYVMPFTAFFVNSILIL